MSINLGSFAAHNPGLFARPNQFEVTFAPIRPIGSSEITKYLTINCNAANIPGKTMVVGDKGPTYRSYVKQKVYDDVTFSFHVSHDFKELRYFQIWLDRMIDPKSNRVQFYDHYKGTITITNKTRTNTTSMITTLHDAYPKRIDPMELNYGTNDSPMALSVTVQYRTYTQTYVTPKVKRDSPEEEGPVAYHDVNEAANKIDIMHDISDKTQSKVKHGGGTSDESDIETF